MVQSPQFLKHLKSTAAAASAQDIDAIVSSILREIKTFQADHVRSRFIHRTTSPPRGSLTHPPSPAQNSQESLDSMTSTPAAREPDVHGAGSVGVFVSGSAWDIVCADSSPGEPGDFGSGVGNGANPAHHPLQYDFPEGSSPATGYLANPWDAEHRHDWGGFLDTA